MGNPANARLSKSSVTVSASADVICGKKFRRALLGAAQQQMDEALCAPLAIVDSLRHESFPSHEFRVGNVGDPLLPQDLGAEE